MTRHPDDFYPTPKVAITELWAELEPRLNEHPWIVDPAAGDGALLRAAPTDGVRSGVEIDAGRAAALEQDGFDVECADYLQYPIRYVPWEGPDLYISNPPFSLAQEFIAKMLYERGPETVVAALLRVGFLGSRKRHEWWKTHKPDAIRVLSARPSFTGDGKTDNSEYAWFIWDPPSGSLGLAPIGWYSGGCNV